MTQCSPQALRYTHSRCSLCKHEWPGDWQTLVQTATIGVKEPEEKTYKRKKELTGRRPCPPLFLCLCRWWLFSCCTACAWCTSAGRSDAGRSSWRPPARGAAAALPGRGPPPPPAPGRWTGILLRQWNTHSKGKTLLAIFVHTLIFSDAHRGRGRAWSSFTAAGRCSSAGSRTRPQVWRPLRRGLTSGWRSATPT